MQKTLQECFDVIRSAAGDPRDGVPEELFEFLRQVMPLANVDLLVQDGVGRTLLAWREDDFFRGWHIPGGILRFREPWASRIAAVAAKELGAEVTFEPAPCQVVEICEHPRAHNVSLLFRCRLVSEPAASFAAIDAGAAPGELRWFESAPPNLLQVHQPYARWFKQGGCMPSSSTSAASPKPFPC